MATCDFWGVWDTLPFEMELTAGILGPPVLNRQGEGTEKVARGRKSVVDLTTLESGVRRMISGQDDEKAGEQEDR